MRYFNSVHGRKLSSPQAEFSDCHGHQDFKRTRKTRQLSSKFNLHVPVPFFSAFYKIVCTSNKTDDGGGMCFPYPGPGQTRKGQQKGRKEESKYM